MPDIVLAKKGNPMNWRLITASLLAAFTTVIHIFWGGRDVVEPLLTSSMAAEPKMTLYAVWHMASFSLFISALFLFMGAFPKNKTSLRYVVNFISILWIGFAIIFVLIALLQSGNGWLMKLPQWILLAPVGILGLWRFNKP